MTGTRLTDIVFDRHEDFLYEDSRAMKLTPYVMSERCLQVEISNIYKDYKSGDYDTLTYILEGGFKGFHKMDSSELIEEYKAIEEQWYNLYECSEFEFTPYEEDPIHKLEEEKVSQRIRNVHRKFSTLDVRVLRDRRTWFCIWSSQ